MKLGVMSPVLADTPLEESLQYLNSLGVQCLELGAGGYPGKAHLDPKDYLGNPQKIKALKELFKKYDISISSICCHGNPVHPNKETAQMYHNEFVDAINIASELEVDTVVGFSGCPGDCSESKNPNWVTCAWPPEYLDILEWQWNDVLIPYWIKTAELAKQTGIKKIAFEMHPGFCVYNGDTLLKLRGAVGDIIGANVDPSHLFWQGMDPCTVIKQLNGAIYNFHAKDTKLNDSNIKRSGVLDTQSYGSPLERSWIFRTVGYGHDAGVWKDIIATLAAVGYDGAVSIEHEDCLMSSREGLEKAVEFLKPLLIYDKPGQMWWA